MATRARGLAIAVVGLLLAAIAGCSPAEDPQAVRCDDAREIFERLEADYDAAASEAQESAAALEQLHPSRGDPEGVDEYRRLLRAFGDVTLQMETLAEQNDECFTVQERLDVRSEADAYREWRRTQP